MKACILVPVVFFNLTSTFSVSAAEAQIRVNQTGFLADGGKTALLMSTAVERNATFQVIDAGGKLVFSNSVGERLGSWSATYANVYQLDFSPVKSAGIYSIRVD